MKADIYLSKCMHLPSPTVYNSRKLPTHAYSHYPYSYEYIRSLFSSLVEQHIGTTALDCLTRDFMHGAVVEVVPFSIVLGVCSVVTSTQASVVVADCVQLI